MPTDNPTSQVLWIPHRQVFLKVYFVYNGFECWFCITDNKAENNNLGNPLACSLYMYILIASSLSIFYCCKSCPFVYQAFWLLKLEYFSRIRSILWLYISSLLVWPGHWLVQTYKKENTKVHHWNFVKTGWVWTPP